MNKKKPIPQECPHCGSEYGYYRKGKVSGSYVCYYNSDGSNGNNPHLHDSIRYHEQKTAYCADCEKPVGVVEASPNATRPVT